jgi:exportin-1
VCLEVIDKFCGADPAISNAFFQQYYLSVVQDIYFVLTDTDHKSGFRLQSQLLARLYQLVETNRITSPLFDPASVSDLNVTNALFMRGYTMDLLKAAFPHVQKCVFHLSPSASRRSQVNGRSVQVQTFVNAIEEYHSDSNQFKLALRDFLIQLKEFSGDNADLFLDEKEAQAQEKAQQEREAAMRIPGMLKPSQMEDKDEEL